MKEMKKLLLMLFVVALPMGFVACSDDDDDEKLAAEVAGSYKGTTTVTELAGMIDPIETTIKVTATGDNVVSIDLGNIAVPSMTIPLGEVKNVKLSGTSGNVVIENTTHSITLFEIVPVSTVVSGSIKDSKEITINSTIELPEAIKPFLPDGMDFDKFTVSIKAEK